MAPGRNAISLDVPVAMARWLTAALLVPLLSGVVAQRWFSASRTLPAVAMGSLHRITHPGQARTSTKSSGSTAPSATAGVRTLVTAVRPSEVPLKAAGFPRLRAVAIGASEDGLDALEQSGVISVKSILKALSARRRAANDVEPDAVPINGVLRIQAMHLHETLTARPFDDLLRPDPRAFTDVNHLMRCRVTGSEVDMDPRLIGLLSQLSTFYGRTLQLISGHRAPGANGTSPTSQHTLGRAADIRVPGVSIGQLKKVAIKLGARGVGIYPEKGFVHVDVRDKQRYYWVWTARAGEQADMGTTAPPRASRHSDSEAAHHHEDHEESEASDEGASSLELPSEPEAVSEPEAATTEPEPAAEPAIDDIAAE